jgi:prepilin-type N-terminal cleavage/methylation domain-containing protein
MPQASSRPRSRSESGFTMVELLTVIVLVAIGTGMVAMVAPAVYKLGKADSGAKSVASVLKAAREEAVSKRRYVQVAFDTTNQNMQISRIDYDWSTTPPTPAPQLEQTVGLEGGVRFMRLSGIAAIPLAGAAPNGNAVTFSTLNNKPTVTFTPEGSAVDATTGDPVDGTIFVGRPNEPQDTYRAVTLTGPTAMSERWRWSVSTWVTAH